MTEEKILARVRKMLALANDAAATEGERDNALRMAYNLLAKNQLDMDDVKAHERDNEDPREHFMNDGWNMLWCKHVRNSVARLFNCSYYFGKKINATRGEHHYIGRESAATTAMYIADWVVQSLLKEADRRYKHRLTAEGRAFAIGASDKLRERVEELLAAKQEEIRGTGSSLVLADLARTEQDANRLFIQNMGIRLTTKSRRASTVDASAYSAGEDFGSTIGLNTQVDNKKGTLAIK
jgi:hypothetical protein